MTIPKCSKCNYPAEERWMVYNKFWYCPDCKVEVAYSKDDEELDSLRHYLTVNTQLFDKGD